MALLTSETASARLKAFSVRRPGAAYRARSSPCLLPFLGWPLPPATGRFRPQAQSPPPPSQGIGLPGFTQHVIIAKSAAGVVIGYSYGGDRPQDSVAFVWTARQGTRDLNGLVAEPGWRLLTATTVNERRQIAGMGRVGPESRAFLLTPISSGTSPRFRP